MQMIDVLFKDLGCNVVVSSTLYPFIQNSTWCAMCVYLVEIAFIFVT